MDKKGEDKLGILLSAFQIVPLQKKLSPSPTHLPSPPQNAVGGKSVRRSSSPPELRAAEDPDSRRRPPRHPLTKRQPHPR